MNDLNRTMQEAMRLMQTGDLHAATHAIQRGLRAGAEPRYATAETAWRPSAGCIEGEYRVVRDSHTDALQAPWTPKQPGPEPSGVDEFRDHRFSCDAGALRYKLFVPAGVAGAMPPLIVMLHGCQ